MTTTAASTILSQPYSYRTILASLPLLLWWNDTVGGLCRVEGTSMQPTLQPGDVVWVRKCESSFWQGSHPGPKARIRRYEHSYGYYWYTCPPTALPGDVVVYRNPQSGPQGKLPFFHHPPTNRYEIKRVWHTSISSTQPYSLIVQGDHAEVSCDSRHTGPISKHLLVGVAEAIVWPPQRWQRIENDRKNQPDRDDNRPEPFRPKSQ